MSMLINHLIMPFHELYTQDFCTSSLKGEVAIESGKDAKGIGIMEKHEIAEEKKWHRK